MPRSRSSISSFADWLTAEAGGHGSLFRDKQQQKEDACRHRQQVDQSSFLALRTAHASGSRHISLEHNQARRPPSSMTTATAIAIRRSLRIDGMTISVPLGVPRGGGENCTLNIMVSRGGCGWAHPSGAGADPASGNRRPVASARFLEPNPLARGQFRALPVCKPRIATGDSV